jgi:KAP-like P-loop domain-containing protein
MQADQPILSSKEDRFGRKQFAHRIADVIATRDSSSGLVVGIHGPWGEGKTSVLNMIEEKLGTHEHVLVIRFNPWRFPEESLLLRSFFLDVARKIDAALLTKKERIISFAEQYADVLSAVPYAGKVTDSFRVLTRKRSTIDIDALKARFEEALAASSKRVVIMMDDIDRLDKSEIQTVFRLVKLLADFPNTTYVLCFDDKRVAEALGERYGHEGGGKNFLEKIIQVPLSLPPASRQVRRAIAIEGLEAALALAKFDLTEDDGRRLGEIFDKGFVNRITTPRVAKRFGNALTFALPILVGETDVVDLILVEGIRIFYPELYVAIRDNADAFSEGVTDPLTFMRDKDNKALAEEVIKNALRDLSEQDRKAASIVIQALFPRTGAAGLFRVGAYASEFNEGRGSEKRIATKQYFPRYFNYGVPSDDISDQDIEQFLGRIPGEAVEALVEQFENLSFNNRAHVLIEKLRNKEDNLHPDTAAILALVVALSGKTFPYTHPTDRFFGLGTISQASALIRHLLHRIQDQSARERLAIELAGSIEPLPFAYDYSSWMRKMKKSRYSNEIVSVVSDQTEQRIKEIVAGRIAASAEVEPIERTYPHDAQQMYQLWAFADKQRLRDYLQRRITISPSDAPEFISAANGINPNSETTRDWQEDLGWFDFICDLIPPRQILETLHATYPGLPSAKNEILESRPMNNRERAARWFQRLYNEKIPSVASAEAEEKEHIEDVGQEISEPPLRIVLEQKLNNKSDERDEYEMNFLIENTQRAAISDYRIEVEFPSEFLHKGWHPSWEVPERQSETHRFFRMTREFFEGGSAKWTLYGKDKRKLMAIIFHVDKSNYRAEFLKQAISVDVYLGENLVAHVETPMRDFVPDR